MNSNLVTVLKVIIVPNFKVIYAERLGTIMMIALFNNNFLKYFSYMAQNRRVIINELKNATQASISLEQMRNMTIKVRRADFWVQVQTWNRLKNHKCQSIHCNIWFQIAHSMHQIHNYHLPHTHTLQL